jgi:hypothetical protein
VTESLTKGLVALRAWTRSRPEQLGDGVAKGIYSLGKGVASGVGGLFLDPIKGFQKEGFTGAGKGVVKGLVGVIVKPAAGALGLVTNITEGIANTWQALEGGGAAARSRAYRPRFSSPNTEGGRPGPAHAHTFQRQPGRGVQFTQVSSCAAAEPCKMGVSDCT